MSQKNLAIDHPYLTDEQWARIAPLLPAPRRMGRRRADDRRTLEAILYVLRTGCRWQDVPAEHGSPATAWRRFKAWEADRTWERVWLALLFSLDAQGKQEWVQAFLDGNIVPTKRGESREKSPGSARASRGEEAPVTGDDR